MIAHLSAALLAALAVAPQQQSDTTLAVAADGRLEIHNVMEGSVTIRTWNQAQARIVAEYDGMIIRSGVKVTADVLAEPLRVEDGRAHVPAGPGLGIEVDEAKVIDLMQRSGGDKLR